MRKEVLDEVEYEKVEVEEKKGWQRRRRQERGQYYRLKDNLFSFSLCFSHSTVDETFSLPIYWLKCKHFLLPFHTYILARQRERQSNREDMEKEIRWGVCRFKFTHNRTLYTRYNIILFFLCVCV